MKVGELIAHSFYLSQINSRSLDVLQVDQSKDGLFYLNLMLSEKSVPANYLPYFSELSFTTVQGQETYFVPKLAHISAITFNFDNVRYPLVEMKVNQYKGTPRANNIESLMYSYWARRVNGGMQISFYFKPNQVYNVEITGKVVPDKVNMDTDLSLFFDDYYQAYLMYDLANRMCQFYGITLPPSVKEQLATYEQNIVGVNIIDTTLKIVNVLGRSGVINYAQVNLGGGWVPAA